MQSTIKSTTVAFILDISEVLCLVFMDFLLCATVVFKFIFFLQQYSAIPPFASVVTLSLYIYLYSYKDVHAHTLITVKLQILNAVKNVYTIVV